MIKLSQLLENEHLCGMSLVENVVVSDNLKYHLKNNLSLSENIFRTYSEKYFELIEEVRKLYFENKIELNDDDAELVESDLGKKSIYEGREIYLDAPIEEEEDVLMEAKHRGKTVKLNRPFRTPGGPKKYAVYVKGKNGNIKKMYLSMYYKEIHVWKSLFILLLVLFSCLIFLIITMKKLYLIWKNPNIILIQNI